MPPTVRVRIVDANSALRGQVGVVPLSEFEAAARAGDGGSFIARFGDREELVRFPQVEVIEFLNGLSPDQERRASDPDGGAEDDSAST